MKEGLNDRTAKIRTDLNLLRWSWSDPSWTLEQKSIWSRSDPRLSVDKQEMSEIYVYRQQSNRPSFKIDMCIFSRAGMKGCSLPAVYDGYP